MSSKKYILGKYLKEDPVTAALAMGGVGIATGAAIAITDPQVRDYIKSVYYKIRTKKYGSYDNCESLVVVPKIIKCKELFVKKGIVELRLEFEKRIRTLGDTLYNKYLQYERAKNPKTKDELYDDLLTIQAKIMLIEKAKKNLHIIYDTEMAKIKEKHKV